MLEYSLTLLFAKNMYPTKIKINIPDKINIGLLKTKKRYLSITKLLNSILLKTLKLILSNKISSFFNFRRDIIEIYTVKIIDKIIVIIAIGNTINPRLPYSLENNFL